MMWNFLIFIVVSINKPYVVNIPELSKEPKTKDLENNVLIKEGSLIKEFLEISPRDSAKPEVNTLVYVGKYKENLYFLFLCKEKGKIKYQVLKRDEFRLDNDWVMISIDPDNSGTRSYTFAMNPGGTLYDDLTISGTTIPSYDFNWNGFTAITDTQWVALFIIPLSTFSKIDPKNFRFLIIRARVSDNFYTYQWPPFPSSSTTDPYGIGILEIEKNFFSASFIPYLICINTHPSYPKKTQLREGLTGRFDYKNNFKILFGINPDFSTVETDEPQITINKPYALFLPEKRPVFIEGGDVFLRDNLIYTRRINNPFGILKTFGKFGNTEFGLISAYDISNSNFITTPWGSYEEISNDSAFINILTLRQYFGRGNYAGGIINTRNYKNQNSNYCGFLECGMDLKRHFLINALYGHSIYYKGELKELGDIYKFKFSSVFHNFNPYLYFIGVSPNYNNQNGYLQKDDFLKIVPGINFTSFINKSILNFISAEILYAKNSDYKRSYENDSTSISLIFSLKQRTQISAYFSYFSQNLYGFDIKDLRTFSFFLLSSPFDFYSLNFFISNGKGINYSIFPPEKANIYYIWINNEVSITKKILLTFGFKRYVLEDLASQNTYFLRFLYTFTNFFSFRFIYSYDGENNGIYPLFTYQITPYDLFFLGGSTSGKFYEKFKKWDKVIFIKLQKVFSF
ncbi:MAG: DUF5916 domain-containing protein [candidate division WOR-3 bacterium]